MRRYLMAIGLTVSMLVVGLGAPIGKVQAATRAQAVPASISGSTSVSRQVAALKKQYKSKVGPALARAALTGSESDADSALKAYEGWMQKVTSARKAVRNKLNVLTAKATALATNVYYLALRTIGSGCSSDPTLQLYDSPQGSQLGISGWVVNSPQVDKFVAFMARHRAKLFITDSPLDSGESAAFQPCRPNGFKFEGLSYIEIDGDVTITQTYTGEACGADPYTAPWKISITETIADSDGSQTRTDIVPVTLNPNSWVESAPDGVPYYGAFHINTDAAPPQMQMRVTPLQDYAEAGGTSSADLVEACQ